ncbi:MAG: acetyl-CoA carboxylase biotin carboxylase subunit [Planctomycetota bacterium]|jgi:acetyl-CoA carboxylase biotin carboxylase subunit|nr:acetyl-CoA carboxylase biotin carboxylase subunit [Planctomycetota bacterium]MDP6989099.1 acetyl-CoA carboxylase biotin carboxylase subunit [Planctomycetota bacterium]
MFRKLLIANRGEVAVRVARTARELGVATVGVFSEADRGASWLACFDETVALGEAAPAASYLAAERVVQAALQTGCSAVHPGWGFLSERPDFAALCAQFGLRFVGPSPGVMERLGRKLTAKSTMLEAGLPVVPGSDGLLADVDEAVALAHSIGYPVMVKADAGGGGRGMRLATDEASLRTGFAEATTEAASAFGDGGLYLERYVASGRHVEVQVLGDAYGAAIHLGERDCSIQRNHQKLVEESPCPALAEDERARLGERAARATAAIGYEGAGTVEFLRTPDGELYFMEMNARLQVEHPLTELTTGVDLVHEQLAVAANQPLRLSQEDVRFCGHAIECRINAEDPARGFLPTPGTLTAFELAPDAPSVRVDTHLAEGEEVSPHYDSLLAKLIAHGETRAEAIELMLAALRASRVEGVSTTIPLHIAVLESEAFGSGEVDTSFIPGLDALSAPRAS